MKVVADLSVWTAPHRPRSQWSQMDLFGGGQQGLLMDASRYAVLFDAVTGGSAIGSGAISIGRAEDQSAKARHLVRAVANLRPCLSARRWRGCATVRPLVSPA